MWVDAWGNDLWTAQGIAQVVNDIRAGNMNAVIPQIRRRGDALYNSSVEPKCHNIAANFDPLAELITRAHNTSAGQRIEVHAWLVTYHVWTTSSTYPKPPQPNHVVNLHPDWLLSDYAGQTLIGNQYTLDPGHPAVQQHTFDVCMDLVRNYDIDGLNFDYIRYSDTEEGYNPVSVARFKRLYNRTATPAPNDAAWKQFRRDQITSLLRKIYLHAIDLKPQLKISCDTITWSPAPVDTGTWYRDTAAWNTVLQDWRGWMQEGILDLNIPMNYFRQTSLSHSTAYTNWSNFAKNNRFNRHAAIGPAIYLNSVADSIKQFRQTRQPAQLGNAADGIVGYSFRATNTNGVSRATFLNALVAPSAHDAQPTPVFAERVPVPEMPWKTQPTRGHLKGFVRDGAVALDGARVFLSGPALRGQTNDATGFYGFVDLVPGTYTVGVTYPGYLPATNAVEITTGAVATLNFALQQPAPVLTSVDIVSGGKVRLHGSGPAGPMAVDWSSNFAQWYPLTNFTTTTNEFDVTDPSATNRERYYRVRRVQ